MALYRLSVSTVARGRSQLTARNVVAAAAYQAREPIFDERQRELRDPAAAERDLVLAEILLPEHAPMRWLDRRTLWNEVDAGERRRDAQLARTLTLTLPRELRLSDSVDLAREFMLRSFVDRGMVADLAVHAKVASDGGPQPHAHALLTTRRIADGAFGLKERAWNAVALLNEWRVEWAEIANRALESAGAHVRVDHRSWVARRERMTEVVSLVRGLVIIGASLTTQAMRDAARRIVPGRHERKRDMPTDKMAPRPPIEVLKDELRRPLRTAAVGVATGAWTYGEAVDKLISDHLSPAAARYPELDSRFEELEGKIGDALTKSVVRVEKQISGNTALLRARAEYRERAMTDEQLVAETSKQMGVPDATRVDRIMATPEFRRMEARVEERIAASSTGEASSLQVDPPRRVVPASAAANYEAHQPSRRAQEASQRSHVAVME
jgi:hypothetical protein